jgi:hypothetical protein
VGINHHLLGVRIVQRDTYFHIRKIRLILQGDNDGVIKNPHPSAATVVLRINGRGIDYIFEKIVYIFFC